MQILIENKTENYTLSYLEGVGALMRSQKMYKTMDTFILENGRSFNVNENTFVGERGLEKMCFMNAYFLAERNPRKYTYTEGYACSMIPMHHAWVVDNAGNVIDPTWKEGRDYYGIPFKLKEIKKNLLSTKHYGCMIDDFLNGFPLLHGKIKIKDVREEKFYLLKKP